MDKKCSGCPIVLKNIALLNCSKCRDEYHYSCDYLNPLRYHGYALYAEAKNLREITTILQLERMQHSLKRVLKFINNSTRNIASTCINNILIVGDFNLGSLSWSKVPNEPHLIANPSNILHSLKQFNYLTNNKNRILDLVFCNKTILELSPSPQTLSVIDPAHPPLNFSLPFRSYSKLDHNNNIKLQFHKADYDNIIKELNSTDWDKILKVYDNVDSVLSRFYVILNLVISKYVPKYVSQPKQPFSRKKINLDSLYKINGTVLTQVDFIRDLGVTLDRQLKFNIHIDTIANKALKILALLSPNVIIKYNFGNADYEGINDNLEGLNWSSLFSECQTVNHMTTIFYAELRKIIEKCVPKKKIKNESCYPVWYSKNLIKR
ncbi:unnamed protein product [Leptidea sinapis]|uniref:Endonuclease/exonuclease/phosphatase domain-containing protein n=1 Tax=Leptidea sinapis TaxID=189913 RepID=A0A5E4Q9N1_9NEOP|nr:unnamed protein product [Leptidea sinapis]